MKVIVVGKGGREHAIVTALVESDSASEVFCYPGSDAILEMAKSLSGEINDVESLVKSMVDEGIDLCVGGEESWLAMGLADKARQAGIPTWGPVQFSSQLEASKEFAKEFMVRHNIPTGGMILPKIMNLQNLLLPVTLQFLNLMDWLPGKESLFVLMKAKLSPF